METVYIEARDLPDLWFQALSALMDKGRRFKVDQGSYEGEDRIELDYFTGLVKFPGTKPTIPHIPEHLGIPNPVDMKYIEGGAGIRRSYLEYLMTPRKLKGEVYTYGERLSVQIEKIIDRYKKRGHRTNQNIMQVGRASDLKYSDPPCLRHIDTRIQDGKLHFFIYFRSWELWAGLPANLAGIQCLKEYMADMIGVNDGEMVVASKGLHIYGHTEDVAKIRLGRKTWR